MTDPVSWTCGTVVRFEARPLADGTAELVVILNEESKPIPVIKRMTMPTQDEIEKIAITFESVVDSFIKAELARLDDRLRGTPVMDVMCALSLQWSKT